MDSLIGKLPGVGASSQQRPGARAEQAAHDLLLVVGR